MYCSISGVIPKEAVVARTTGLVFEKGLIEKALRVEEKCPVTGAPLRNEDLIVIQANKATPPVTTNTSSVPGMLQALQNEWDETVLETFNLRQQLDATRKELAHALYQHDAACRVIARLVRERDEAYQLVNAYKAGGGSQGQPSAPAPSAPTSSNAAMEVEGEEEVAKGLNEEVVSELNSVCKSLSSGRKQRKPSEHLQSKDDMMLLEESASYAPHKKAAANALLVRDNSVITAGVDRAVVISDTASGSLQCQLTGHTGAVTSLAAAPGAAGNIFSGSEDKTVRFWTANSSGGYSERFRYTKQAAAITGVTLHPSAHYLVSSAQDGSWHFLDIERATCLATSQDDAAGGYSSVAFHPDGLLLGTSIGNAVKIWDVREQKHVVTLQDTSTQNQALGLTFSENGYYAAVGYAEGLARVWDLRKQSVAKAFELGRGDVKSVAFDFSGVYLALGGGGDQGNAVHVKVVKDWSSSVTVPSAHSGAVTGVAWAEHARALWTTSLDKTVKVFAKRA